MNTEMYKFIMLAIIFLVVAIILYKMIFSDPFIDEIYSKRRYKTSQRDPLLPYTGDWIYQGEVERIVIKRTYSSGKIKFIEKEVKI